MMKINTFNDYPPLSETIPKNDLYHSFFQEKLVFFYFQLSRKSRFRDISILSENLNNVLYFLKKLLRIYPEEWIIYLKHFYGLMIHTRDIIFGKGEHELTYMMIHQWYTYFPSLAVFFIHKMVDDKLKIGCWRDIRYLCEYVKEISTDCVITTSIYNVCISLINKQVTTDLYNYNNSNWSLISNVSKWIPREKKRFDWFYTKIVIEWSKINCPYYLNSKRTNFIDIVAGSTCKKKYRKMISTLNKFIDTTEIKMSSNEFKEIIPENVSDITVMKHPCLLYENKYTNPELVDQIKIDDREECYSNFRTFFNKEKTQNTEKINSIPRTLVPISHFIKQAFELVELTKKFPDNENISYRIKMLNKKWWEYSNIVIKNRRDYFIPFLDVSQSIQQMDAESYYTAIGLALLLCEMSYYGKRIMAIDNLPVWINLQETNTLFEMITEFDHILQSCKSSFFDIEKAVDVLVFSFQKTNMNYYDIDKMKIVILSDFAEYKINENDDFISFDNNNQHNTIYDKMKNRFSVKYTEKNTNNIPNFVFWNLSKQNLIQLPGSIYEEKIMFCSGFEPLFNELINNNSPYNTVCSILKKKRYSPFYDYIDRLVLS